MYYQQPMYQPYPMYYAPPVAQNMQMQQQMTQPTEQNGSIIHTSNDFIPVKNMEEAKNYPVAPGNCVTFKDENAPYIYTKTMGFSQFDRPQFEKIRLVKETETIEEPIVQEHNTPVAPQIDIESEVSGSSAVKEINDVLSTLTDEMESVHKDINYLRDKIEDVSKRRKTASKKVGESDDAE